MIKWQATLSTTEPYNYIGSINVRQGNRNTEILEVTIVENALPLDLSGCEVFLSRTLVRNIRFNGQQKLRMPKKGLSSTPLTNIRCKV